jgi:hypothetical protein
VLQFVSKPFISREGGAAARLWWEQYVLFRQPSSHFFSTNFQVPDDTAETMSGEEQDYAIETADAGASDTIPMEAGQIKKGGYV